VGEALVAQHEEALEILANHDPDGPHQQYGNARDP
jgi:hypothetical protein